MPAIGVPDVPPKNNPLMLVSVMTVIISCVLCLALIGRIDTRQVVEGRAMPGGGPLPSTSTTETPRPRAVQRLADHPLLTRSAALPQVTCELPEFGISDEELSAYYTDGVRCLDQAWGPLLAEANLPFDPPALNTSPDLTGGPCGEAPSPDEAVAYYCGRNRTIYMPSRRLRENGGGDRPATHLATLAHEYGHHVQAMSGILRAADTKIIAAGEKTPAGLEMSRRIELQANCFAGMFLAAAGGRGSISDDLARLAEEDFGYAVEEPEEKNAHGSPDNQARWAVNGFEAGTASACNTYTASADEVA